MIGIEQLTFDPTDSFSLDASHNVGAYVRSGDTGALVTHSFVTPTQLPTQTFVDGDVTTGTDNINITAHGYEIGTLVQLTTTGTLPAGLALVTDYYVIRVDDDNIKLAASLSDAEDGTPVDITAAAGGGTHTVDPANDTKIGLDVNILNKLGLDVDLDHTEDSVRLGDGTSFFTSTSENSDIALDVHISNTDIAINDGGNSITVDAVQLDIDDLNATDDAVASWAHDGTGNAITSTTGALDVFISNASIAVTATDLDIRDLTHVSDSIKIGDGTDFLAIDASGNIGVTDAGGSLTVDAVDLDIRDLDHATDNVQLGDGTDLITSTLVGAKQSLDVYIANDINVSDVADTAINSTQKNVTTTSGVLLASELAARKYLYVQNLGANSIYIGEAGVTTGTGIKMAKGSLAELRIGPSLSLHAVASSGTVDARLMELS